MHYIQMVTVDMLYGGSNMTLYDIIIQLDSFDDESTIYVKHPWEPESEAVVAIESDDGSAPTEAEKINAQYFLEIFLVREFLEGWLSNSNDHPTELDKCLRLISYAENDA